MVTDNLPPSTPRGETVFVGVIMDREIVAVGRQAGQVAFLIEQRMVPIDGMWWGWRSGPMFPTMQLFDEEGAMLPARVEQWTVQP